MLVVVGLCVLLCLIVYVLAAPVILGTCWVFVVVQLLVCDLNTQGGWYNFVLGSCGESLASTLGRLELFNHLATLLGRTNQALLQTLLLEVLQLVGILERLQ